MTRAISWRRNRAALRRLVRQLVRSRRGIASIEFAILAPVMITFYLAAVELAQGVMVDRRVTQLTRTLADLTSQAKSLSSSDISNIFDAAQAVMIPFTSVTPQMSIMSVVVDGAGKAKVCWSQQRNSTVEARGATIVLPAGLGEANSSLIVARASYNYKTMLYPGVGTLTIGGNPIYMRPRIGKPGGSTMVEQVELVGTAMCPA